MISDYIKQIKQKKIDNLKEEQERMLRQCVIPENFLYFAVKNQNKDWFDLEGFTKYVLKTNSELIYRFARYIRNADIERLQNAIYENTTLHHSYTKMSAINNSKHRFYGVPSWLDTGLKFAQSIPNADKNKAIEEFEKAITKVVNNQFEDKDTYNKNTVGAKIYRNYLHDKWMQAIINYSQLEGFDAKKIGKMLINSKTFPKDLVVEYASKVKDANLIEIYNYLINNNETELATKLLKSRPDYKKQLKINSSTSTM